MAKKGLTEIKTRSYQKDALAALSKKVAEESETAWVDLDEIEAYNRGLGVKEAGAPRKAFWFCVHDKPYLALIICMVVLGGICWLINPFLGVLGAFLGFVGASFLFPALYSNCSLCRSLKSCNKVFEHVLNYQQHQEKRVQDNGAEITVLVRQEEVFVVLECQKCKGRKIEIIRRQREKVL